MSLPRTVAIVGLLAAAASARAGSFELAGRIGPSLPFYHQSFALRSPGLDSSALGLEPLSDLRLDASGGLSFGGGIAWHAAGPFGLEVRVDTGTLELAQSEARFRITVRPPAPLPPIGLDFETQGSIELGRLRPVSVNLRYRGDGRLGLVASGGVSHLPAMDVAIEQELRPERLAGLDIPSLELAAGGRIEGFWGVNAGLGVQVRLGERLALDLEGRAFFFGERELEWSVERFPLDPALGESLRQRLDPVRFTPGFFQATAGLAVRF